MLYRSRFCIFSSFITFFSVFSMMPRYRVSRGVKTPPSSGTTRSCRRFGAEQRRRTTMLGLKASFRHRLQTQLCQSCELQGLSAERDRARLARLTPCTHALCTAGPLHRWPRRGRSPDAAITAGRGEPVLPDRSPLQVRLVFDQRGVAPLSPRRCGGACRARLMRCLSGDACHQQWRC